MMAIFINTFIREYRNKFLHFISVVTLLLILGFQYAQINFSGTENSNAQISMYMFYRFIFVWINLISGVIGVQLIANDIESKMLHQVLAFPQSRLEFLLARVLSGWSMVTAYYFVSLVLFGLVSFFFQGQSGFSWQIFLSVLVSSLVALSVIIIALFFSLLLPKLPALLVTLSVIMFVWFSVKYFSSLPFENWKQIEWSISNLIGFVFYIGFPHISIMNEFALQIAQQKIIFANLWLELPHLIFTLTIWFLLSWWLLRKKEI